MYLRKKTHTHKYTTLSHGCNHKTHMEIHSSTQACTFVNTHTRKYTTLSCGDYHATHMEIHSSTQARMHKHARTRHHRHTHTHTHTHTHIHTYTQREAITRWYTQTGRDQAHTQKKKEHTHSFIRSRMPSQTILHSQPPISLSLPLSASLPHAHLHTNTITHTNNDTHAHTHARTHSRTHALIAPTRARARTHTHTHTHNTRRKKISTSWLKSCKKAGRTIIAKLFTACGLVHRNHMPSRDSSVHENKYITFWKLGRKNAFETNTFLLRRLWFTSVTHTCNYDANKE